MQYQRPPRRRLRHEPRALVLSVVEELLPLNAERRLEVEVTVALVAEAPGNDKAREVLDESYETVREACRRLVTRLRRAGLAVLDLDVEVETMALHGLVDGLGSHLLISPAPAFDNGRVISLTFRWRRLAEARGFARNPPVSERLRQVATEGSCDFCLR